MSVKDLSYCLLIYPKYSSLYKRYISLFYHIFPYPLKVPLPCKIKGSVAI